MLAQKIDKIVKQYDNSSIRVIFKSIKSGKKLRILDSILNAIQIFFEKFKKSVDN